MMKEVLGSFKVVGALLLVACLIAGVLALLRGSPDTNTSLVDAGTEERSVESDLCSDSGDSE